MKLTNIDLPQRHNRELGAKLSVIFRRGGQALRPKNKGEMSHNNLDLKGSLVDWEKIVWIS